MDSTSILEWLIYIGLAGILLVLLFGIVSMLRGGAFNKKYGNIFMRWRVGLQFAVVVLLLLLWLVGRN